MNNDPICVTEEEVKEIAGLEWLQDSWGALDAAEMREMLKECYLVKFKFVNESPGYVGDLFLIQSGNLAEELTVTRLIRDKSGALTPADPA